MQKSSLIRPNQADVFITFAKIAQIYFYCTEVSWDEENSTHLQQSDIIIFAHAKYANQTIKQMSLITFGKYVQKLLHKRVIKNL